MAATPNANAITLAQQLMSLCGQLDSIKQQADRIVSVYNAEGVSAIWSAMPTTALNADGTPGAADGTPSGAHPITAGGLDVSSAKLVSGIVLLEQLQNLFNGAAVTTGNYTQTVRDLAAV